MGINYNIAQNTRYNWSLLIEWQYQVKSFQTKNF